MNGGPLDLLVLGDINPDVLVRGGDVAPRFGQRERLVDAAELTLGGSGSITAVGAARLGLSVAIAGVVGDDVPGRFCLDALRERGVDVGPCRIDPGRPTGLSVVLCEEGDRATLTSLGTMAELTVDQVDPDALRRAAHIHVSSPFLQTALLAGLPRLLAAARERGVTTSVDPNWDVAERWEGLAPCLPHLSVLLPNEQEALALTGRNDGDLRAAAAELGRDGTTVAIKRGADGALAWSDGDFVLAGSVEVEAVDSTGAGDSFDAGFICGMRRGAPLVDALALACACGALSTTALGGTSAQPTLAEALAARG